MRAQTSVLPLSGYGRLLKKPKLHKSNAKLTAYSGTAIKVTGKCRVSILYKRKMFPVHEHIVADTKSTPILRLKTCKRLNLIRGMYQVNSNSAFLEEFEDCFGELGTFLKEYHMAYSKFNAGSTKQE